MNFDINEIRELIKLVNESNLSALEVQEGALKVRLEKSERVEVNAPQASVKNESLASADIQDSTKTKSSKPCQSDEPKAESTEVKQEENYKVIKAPMVGAYHNIPGGNIGPGTKLKKGDRVCIIEAMKLMNELTMEEDGEIVSMEINEGEMVEYGQILVKYK